MRRTIIACLFAVAALGGSGCGDDTTTTYKSISIAPPVATVAVGATQTFVAQATKSDNTVVTLSDADLTWSSSNTEVATMSGGVATGVKAGTATITATYSKNGQNLSGTAALTVKEKKIVAVTIDPPTASAAAGTTQQFTATANYDDGTNGDVTATATWSSSDTTIATVDNAGLATAVKAGTATISADVNGTKGNAVLTVTTGIKTIAVTPTNASIGVGIEQQYTAMATLNDNSQQDVTNQATWASSDATVASINAAGLAKGLKVGTTKISATVGTVKGETDLTVTAAVCTKLNLTPKTPVVNVGGPKVVFTANCVMSDGTNSDVTATATWTSSDPTVATVDATGATPIKVGTTTITASYTPAGGTALTDTATLVVTAAVCTAITVSPSTASIPAGATQAFTAVCTMSAGAPMDVTSAASWQSSDTAVATIAAGGLATGLAAGTTNITATFNGVTNTPAATLTVTNATLSDITIAPAGPVDLALGATQAFTATGLYSDGSSLPITNLVTWQSSPAGILSFTGATAKGDATGTATVTATYQGVTSSVGVVVAVGAKVLTSIAVTPATPAALPPGGMQAFTATATYSDNSTGDVTALVTWASSNTSVATISNGAADKGVATAVAGGTTNITATLDGVPSPAVVLTVQAAGTTLSFITLQDAAGDQLVTTQEINKGQTIQVFAMGHYSDGSVLNISAATATVLAVQNTAGTLVANLNAVKVALAPIHIDVTGVTNTLGLAGQVAVLKVSQGSVSAQVAIKVKDTSITSIDVNCTGAWQTTSSPTSPTFDAKTCLPMAIGYKALCRATAHYTDLTTGDITHNAATTWVSTDTAVASNPTTFVTIGGVEYAEVQIAAAGLTEIRASNAGVQSAINATAPDVTDAWTVEGADQTFVPGNAATVILPSGPSANKGDAVQFTARGYFTGTCANVTRDITKLVTWSSSVANVATISNAASDWGLAQTNNQGTSVITWAYGTDSKQTTLTVNARCLVDVTIDAVPGAVADPAATGEFFVPTYVTIPLTVKGYYSDAPTTPVALAPTPSPVGTWSGGSINANTWVLTVNNTNPGTLTFTAGAAFTCSGSAIPKTTGLLKVDAGAVLSSLAITQPASAQSVPAGTKVNYVATATFTGYGAFNVSSQATWSVTPASLGSLAGVTAPAPAEEVTAGTGSGTVIAVYGSLTATQGLTVNTSTVSTVSCAIDPAWNVNAYANFPVGIKVHIKCTVTYSDGSHLDNPPGISFVPSDSNKLQFVAGDPLGWATTKLSGGTAPTVTATIDGISNTTPLPVPINTNVLLSMTFNPALPGGMTIPVQTIKPLGITGNYGPSGGATAQTFDIAGLVSSFSGNGSLVGVSTTLANGTLVTGNATTSGTPVDLTIVKDTVTSVYPVIVDSTACLRTLAVTPAAPAAVPIGSTQVFVATATDNLGNDTIVTTDCTWSPFGAGANAFVESTVKGTYVANAKTTTPVEIKCTYVQSGTPVCDAGNPADTTLEAVANMSVTDAVINSVAIFEGASGITTRNIPIGESVQLDAIATMSDTTTPNITDASSWTSQAGTIASITNSGTKGILTGVAAGQTIITVTTANGKTANITVTVADCGNPAVVVSTSGSGPLPIAYTRQYKATANYSAAGGCSGWTTGLTGYDVTTKATWAITDQVPVVAGNTVATITPNGGLATGVAAGAAKVQATYKTVASAKVDVDVAALTLTGLCLNPAPTALGIGAGGVKQIGLQASYSNGAGYTWNCGDLNPPAVTWTIEDGTIISITGPDSTSNGTTFYTLHGLAEGNSDYRADKGLMSSTTYNAVVSAACNTAIAITTPNGDINLPAGVPYQLQATCTLSDGSTEPCAPTAVNWNVVESNGGSNNVVEDWKTMLASDGLVRVKPTAVAGQYATVSASIGGCAGSTVSTTVSRKITVIAGSLTSLAISPATDTIPQNTKRMFTAVGTYDSGAGNFPVTAAATYYSSNTSVATADNDTTGNVTAKTINGNTIITAEYAGVTSNAASLTVTGKSLTTLAIIPGPNRLNNASTTDAYFPGNGFTLQLAAWASYSDGSPADEVTNSTTWTLTTCTAGASCTGGTSCCTGNVVTGTQIDFNGVKGLLYTGNPVDDSVQVVTATYTLNGITRTDTINVHILKAALASLTINKTDGTTPAPNSLPKGGTYQYSALAGLVGDAVNKYFVTDDVTWTSSAPSVGTVTNGLFSASTVNTGNTNLTANRGAISFGPLAVTVTNATATSVYCKPSAVTLAVGSTAQLTAWIRLSDGSPDVEVTTAGAATSWNVVNGGVINVTNLGVASAVAVGSDYAVPSYQNAGGALVTADHTAGDGCLVTVN